MYTYTFRIFWVGLWQKDFSRIFIFEPPDFFADSVAGVFLLILVGESAQRNPPGKSPAKSSKTYTTKIPDNFLQRGRANIFSQGAAKVGARKGGVYKRKQTRTNADFRLSETGPKT